MTPIEKMARAIFTRYHQDMGRRAPAWGNSVEVPSVVRRVYLTLAHAALETFEPSEGMIEAAQNTNEGGGIADNGGLEPDIYDPETVFRAMIRAAIEEGP